MKLVLFIFLVLMNGSVNAGDYKMVSIGPSVSIHPFARSNEGAHLFENKLTNDGTLVSNIPTAKFDLFTTRGSRYEKKSFFYSRDCVNSEIYGFGMSSGNRTSYLSYYGFAFGGYFMNEKKWKEKNITRSWISLGNNRGIVPIIGLETNWNLFVHKNMHLDIHTYWNPFLINTTLSFGFHF